MMHYRGEVLARALMKRGIDEAPARKAGRVLAYYETSHGDERFPLTQRISYIWRGMIAYGVEPYLDELECSTPVFEDPKMTDIYRALDSIEIGVAVGVEMGLLNVCEHTKYALSAKGTEFFSSLSV